MRRDPIPCEIVLQRLWAFLDGELDPASGEEVRRHLEMCGRCYPRYDFQRAYFRLMERVAAEPVPEALRSRVFHTLLMEQ